MGQLRNTLLKDTRLNMNKKKRNFQRTIEYHSRNHITRYTDLAYQDRSLRVLKPGNGQGSVAIPMLRRDPLDQIDMRVRAMELQPQPLSRRATVQIQQPSATE